MTPENAAATTSGFNISDMQIQRYCKYLTVETNLFIVFPATLTDTKTYFRAFELYCLNQDISFEEIRNSDNLLTEMHRKVFRRNNYHGLTLRVIYVVKIRPSLLGHLN